MKNKKTLLLSVISLLLTSCQKNIFLTKELKYNEYKLFLTIFNQEKSILLEKQTLLNEEFGNKCVSLYNNLLESDSKKELFEKDGFIGTDYYCCLFKGEYQTSLLINKDDNYNIIVNTYNTNYKYHTYKLSNFNNSLKGEINEIVLLLEEKLQTVPWEESNNYC